MRGENRRCRRKTFRRVTDALGWNQLDPGSVLYQTFRHEVVKAVESGLHDRRSTIVPRNMTVGGTAIAREPGGWTDVERAVAEALKVASNDWHGQGTSDPFLVLARAAIEEFKLQESGK